VLTLRKALGGAILSAVSKDVGDRVVRFSFEATDALGETRARTLVAQLTGRAANLFLLDEKGRVLDRMRPARGAGQEVGEVYEPPARQAATQTATQTTEHAAARTTEQTSPHERAVIRQPLDLGEFASVSAAADDFYRRAERERAFDSRAAAAVAKLKQETTKRRKLVSNLARDLAAHGDAEGHRRAGDLLLANLANAERSGATVRLIDFYAEGAPVVELEVDEHRTLQEEAARRFALYAKAKRAAQELAGRIEAVEKELATLDERRAALDEIVNARDEAALDSFTGAAGRGAPGARREGEAARTPKREAPSVPGVRRYRSTDGYEILVGRGARDNDHLTFRVARSQDTWLHAADYPGSHVVVRNHRRDADVPHRTVVEAAQLAAHFSQARKDAKVAVNYTQRKFVSKPKAAAHGLVRLSSFRTLLVEPREDLERL
jgi:predicted ribosome quality control (RQC) complex YloA/Tae2 family protein